MLIGCASGKNVEDDVNTEISDVELSDDSADDISFEDSGMDKSNSVEIETEESKNFIYGEWNNYTIIIDGKEFAFPCKYMDLANALDKAFEDFDYNTYLPAGCSVKEDISLLTQTGSYVFAKVKVMNMSQDDMPITECMVVRIDIMDTVLEEWKHDLLLPGDIRIGDTVDESDLVSRLGNMSWINDRGYIKVYSWNASQEYPEHNCYQIETSGGVISNVVLDCTYLNGFPEILSADIPSDPDNLGTDWLTFEMCIGGKRIKLPTTINELNSLFGLVLAPEKEEITVRSRGVAYADFLDKDGNVVLGAELSNRTLNEELLKNCAIDELCFNWEEIKNTLNVPVRFPGGLCLGEPVNIKYLIKLWGEPETIRLISYSPSDNEIITKFHWYEDGTTNNIELIVKNGVLVAADYNGGMVLP